MGLVLHSDNEHCSSIHNVISLTLQWHHTTLHIIHPKHTSPSQSFKSLPPCCRSRWPDVSQHQPSPGVGDEECHSHPLPNYCPQSYGVCRKKYRDLSAVCCTWLAVMAGCTTCILREHFMWSFQECRERRKKFCRLLWRCGCVREWQPTLLYAEYSLVRKRIE